MIATYVALVVVLSAGVSPLGVDVKKFAVAFTAVFAIVYAAWIGLAIKSDGAAVAGGGITESLIIWLRLPKFILGFDFVFAVSLWLAVGSTPEIAKTLPAAASEAMCSG